MKVIRCGINWYLDLITSLIYLSIWQRTSLKKLTMIRKRKKQKQEETEQLEESRVYTEKAMASHSSTLDWKIPWTEEPGRLQSMGSLRVGHD